MATPRRATASSPSSPTPDRSDAMLAIPKSGPLARTTMAYVLAGGRGSRLMELTDRRAKPAVYFGCKSRIIDFALSNALNSGIRRIGVATQYKAHSLIRHLQRGWNFFRVERNESFDILPASQRVSETEWYAGTADAVYQNIDIIESYSPDHIIILGGDHVYKMDYEPMLQMHHERQADVTVGCIEVPREEASDFGVMAVDGTDRILSFLEKPKDPPGMPDKPDKALASMGIYVFATKFLFDQLRRDAADPNSNRDFGKDLIPYLVKHGKAQVHRFTESCVRSGFEAEAYWRDVGTLDAYWQANIDLTEVIPQLDLYDSEWPIWTYAEVTPPAKFVHDADGRRGQAISSLVSGGCIISGASLHRSLLFTGVHMHSFASIENTVVMPYVDIGRSAWLRNVIIDRGVRIPEGLVVGEDPIADAKRFRRTEQGVCLITQPMLDRLR
jgi:glucose-1-phosphate adenylyltransferase